MHLKVPDSPRRAACTLQSCCCHLRSFRPTPTSVEPWEFGREVRTVELDEERAPLVRWAFRRFATEDW